MTPIDWIIVGLYVAVVLAIGWLVGRGAGAGGDEMFLAGRSVPTWAATLSLVATIQSAATVVAGPEMVFRNDLCHLMRINGQVLGAFAVAYWILPALYRAGTATIYGVLETRFGLGARRAASGVYLAGVLLSAGARMLIAAIAFAMILFGRLHFETVLITIVLVGLVGTIYTATGGMRAVVWTDVLQAAVYISAAIGCLVTLAWLIPLSWPEIWNLLRTGGSTGRDKLRVVELSWNWSEDDTLWTALTGMALFHAGNYSTQQDVTQRLLACRDAGAARAALLRGVLVILVTSWLFAAVGLLLFAYYQSAGLHMADTRTVYADFIVNHLPVGLKGLVVAGIFASAMSSFDSVVNSIAACVLTDFRSAERAASEGWKVYRRLVGLAGLSLIVVACFLAWIQLRGTRELFDFAVMASAYGVSSLLGVILAAILTQRGTSLSACGGLVAGAAAVGAGALLPKMTGGLSLGFPWWILLGVAASFGVTCVAPRRHRSVPQ